MNSILNFRVNLLVDVFSQPWFILIAIVVIICALGGVSYLIYRILNRNNKEEKPSEEEIALEDESRYLEEVKDEDTLKEFENYKNEEDKKDNQ